MAGPRFDLFHLHRRRPRPKVPDLSLPPSPHEGTPIDATAPATLELFVEPTGEIYRFAHNAMSDSEFAGATFSPDVHVLFVNRQHPGHTLAFYGPWNRA